MLPGLCSAPEELDNGRQADPRGAADSQETFPAVSSRQEIRDVRGGMRKRGLGGLRKFTGRSSNPERRSLAVTGREARLCSLCTLPTPGCTSDPSGLTCTPPTTQNTSTAQIHRGPNGSTVSLIHSEDGTDPEPSEAIWGSVSCPGTLQHIDVKLRASRAGLLLVFQVCLKSSFNSRLVGKHVGHRASRPGV